MKKMRFLSFFCFLLLTLHSCKSPKNKSSSVTKGEYIYRQHNEELFVVESMSKVAVDPYPWEQDKGGKFPKITKEFFRCKGDLLNPSKPVQRKTEMVNYFDCGGTQRHSLPIRDKKEFIYPILIDLLNYLQFTTEKKVIITCGHCCLEHNTYLDSSPANQASKHLLGAEVDFYIEGMEKQPEEVIKLIQTYYEKNPKYKDLKEYLVFQRFTGTRTNVTIQPWYNKEIFIKLFQSHEGRDNDNHHNYPYISIQVRYDWDLKENVTYSWDKAFRNFYRR